MRGRESVRGLVTHMEAATRWQAHQARSGEVYRHQNSSIAVLHALVMVELRTDRVVLHRSLINDSWRAVTRIPYGAFEVGYMLLL